MTTDLKKKITQLHSFIDEAFDEKKTASYQLLLQMGVNDIQVAIHDKQQNKYKINYENVCDYSSE